MHKLTPEDEMLDLEARCLLLEDDNAKKQAAIRLLKTRYERPVMAFLGDLFADLEADERATAVNDALSEIYRMSLDGTLDSNNELSGLIFTVAKCRAIDLRRHHSRRIPSAAKLPESVGDYLKDTDVGSDWRYVAILDRAADVMVEFRSFVRMLPRQQKRVGSIMADALPDQMTDREIADEILSRFGVHVSQLEVKGAKQALMKKFREILKRRLK
jgi:DNA-directed RNA polymerase specialized sigma24 family protein